MNKLKVDQRSFKSDLKKLRILLIALTLLQIGYIIIAFVDVKLWVKLDLVYKVNWLILGLHFIIAGIFIWFNWTRMPINNTIKKNNMFMILFLGIIGMWLWIPNKSEIIKLTE
jgi:hypothetical protein